MMKSSAPRPTSAALGEILGSDPIRHHHIDVGKKQEREDRHKRQRDHERGRPARKREIHRSHLAPPWLDGNITVVSKTLNPLSTPGGTPPLSSGLEGSSNCACHALA